MQSSREHVARRARASYLRALAAAALVVATGAASIAPYWLSLPIESDVSDLAERALAALSATRLHLAEWLAAAADRWGCLPVLLGLAVLSRLAVLPYAIKTDRDRIVTRRIAPEMKRLTEQLRHDAVRRARALCQLRRREGLTPVRNLVALLGIPILMLAGVVVGDAAAIGRYTVEPLGPFWQPDPTCLTAVLSAALIGTYVDLALCHSRRQRLAAWLGLTPFLVLVLAVLPAGTNIFFVVSALLLLLQHAVTGGAFQRLSVAVRRTLARWRCPDGVVPLGQAAAHLDDGAEAARLGSMIDAGFPVPRGVVLMSPFLAQWRAVEAEARARLARRVMRAVGKGPYVVWMSDPLDVDRRKFDHRIAWGELAAAIDQIVGPPGPPAFDESASGVPAGTVIVQIAVEGVHNGMLATEAPDVPGSMLVEKVQGEMRDLSTGRVSPNSFRFGRRTARSLGGTSEVPYAMQLVAIGQRLEAHFGAPQAIEWAWDGQRLWIVRSRDIGIETTPMPRTVRLEWERALSLVGDGGEDARETLVRGAMCESLPRPTPATLSLIEALHASGGGVDLACRALGLRYEVQEDAPPLFPSLFGRLYYNVAEADRRLPRLTWLDRWRIRRRAAALEQRMRHEVLPRLLARHISTATSTFDGLSTGRLVREIRVIFEHFVTEIAAETEIASIIAEVLVDDARRALAASGHDPAEWFGQVDEAHDDRSETLRTAFARRRLLDYALATPRSSHDARRFADVPYAFRHDSARRNTASGDDGVLSRRKARMVAAARSARRLSEDVRRAAMREVDFLRKALLAVDRRFDLENGVFLLSLEEIMGLSNVDRERVSGLMTVRRTHRASIALAGTLPERLSLSVLELALWLEGNLNETGGGRTERPCFGVRVSGARRVGGRTCVVDEASALAGEPLSRLMPGDVLVAPFIHEAWLSDIVRASGVILSEGGWLCEAAIVARQRNIAMMVDVTRWGDIPDGGYVTLELDGSIRIDAPPAPPTRGILFAAASST